MNVDSCCAMVSGLCSASTVERPVCGAHRICSSCCGTACGASAEEEIRRALGISNRADFVIVSEYLTRLNLIRVGPGGRSLTSDGRRYRHCVLPARTFRDRISRRINLKKRSEQLFLPTDVAFE